MTIVSIVARSGFRTAGGCRNFASEPPKTGGDLVAVRRSKNRRGPRGRSLRGVCLERKVLSCCQRYIQIARRVDCTMRGQVALIAFLFGLGFCGPTVWLAAQSNSMSGIVVDGKKFTGRILYRDTETLGLLRRDGALAFYPVANVELQKSLGQPFRPYSRDELESRLRGEYPTRYSIVFTDHFAVVFPTDSEFAWATMFERMFRLFSHYFESRGFELREPTFPMIAVVLRTRAEFDRQLDRTELADQSNVQGFYSRKSNRIYTYNQALTGDRRADANALTVIHEATHQSAFNTGVHDRFGLTPRWVSEGLANMFEAPGVYNSVDFPEQEDRVAPHYLRSVHDLMRADRFRGKIRDLVSSDELFRTDPDSAYAVAWALTLYLSENRPQSYRDYLQSGFQSGDDSQSPERRLAGFRAAFGDNLLDLETRLLQFFDEELLADRQ